MKNFDSLIEIIIVVGFVLFWIGAAALKVIQKVIADNKEEKQKIRRGEATPKGHTTVKSYETQSKTNHSVYNYVEAERQYAVANDEENYIVTDEEFFEPVQAEEQELPKTQYLSLEDFDAPEGFKLGGIVANESMEVLQLEGDSCSHPIMDILDGNLQQGIILAEILGKPKALQTKR